MNPGPIRVLTATTLVGLAGLHVAWARGSSFPCADRATLADTVIGGAEVRGPRECYAVAGLLTVAAVLVADIGPIWRPIRQVGVTGVAGVLGVRSAFGLAGQTSRLVPGSDSPRFVALDRRFYGPLCAVLALGAAWSSR